MLYIRVDTNEKIATGHIMRCMAIADAGRKLGEDTTFIMADDKGQELLNSKGYRSIILNTVWNDMNKEIAALIEVIKEKGIKNLLIDSYFVTERYLSELQKVTHVAYIDDLNLFKYPIDSLICYASYYKKFSYDSIYKDTELLLGTSFAPLRQEFSNCKKKKITPKIDNILLMSGGTDQYNIIESILDILDKVRYSNIYVVCGIFYDGINYLKKKYEEYPSVKILKNVSNLKDYMDTADLAISGAGTTLYELCAVGLPTASYVLADNQIYNAERFDADRVIPCMGDVRYDAVVHNVKEYLEEIEGNYEARKKISIEMQKYVDGKGAMRIAQKMKEWNLKQL